MVSAFGHHSHVVLNQVEVADKASKMKAVKPLLDPIPLAGRVVTADALHTQVETARYLVGDQQAHYKGPQAPASRRGTRTPLPG